MLCLCHNDVRRGRIANQAQMIFKKATAHAQRATFLAVFWACAIALGAMALGGGVFLGQSAAPTVSNSLPATSADAPLAAQSGR